MGFSQGLNGLRAIQQNIDIISNNVANAETVGFKGSRGIFQDVYTQARVGAGARLADVQQNFASGALTDTGRTLDVAIGGEGFFRLQDGQETVYSRNGQFQIDRQGFIVNAAGARLTGFPPEAGFTGIPEAIQVPRDGVQAVATTEASFSLNLDSNAAVVPAAPPIDPADPDTYSFSNSVTAFDSLGNERALTLYWARRTNGPAPTEWSVGATLDGADASGVVDLGTLSFDANGQIDAATSTINAATFVDPVAPDLDNASEVNIEFDFTGTTQFATGYSINEIDQNGYPPGQLSAIEIDTDGTLFARYSNDEIQSFGRMALVNFPSQEGLTRVGENHYKQSPASGIPVVGVPENGRFGKVFSGNVESSNVDLQQELVSLIVSQRTYQANANTIRTASETLQEITNLR